MTKQEFFKLYAKTVKQSDKHPFILVTNGTWCKNHFTYSKTYFCNNGNTASVQDSSQKVRGYVEYTVFVKSLHTLFVYNNKKDEVKIIIDK